MYVLIQWKVVSLQSNNANFNINMWMIIQYQHFYWPSCCFNSRAGSSFDWSLFSSPSQLPCLRARLGDWPHLAAASTAGTEPASFDPRCWQIRVSCTDSCSTGFFSGSESVLSVDVSGEAKSTSLFKGTGFRRSLVLMGAAGWLSLPCAVAPDLSDDWLRFSATWIQKDKNFYSLHS